jgi:L-ascorbate metabolism protein UlaG (beta-lactamase superfamily)
MNIRFLGHATFFITTGGKKIVTDPYEPGGFGGAIGYGPLREAADYVTVSHAHADHNYVRMVPGNPRVIERAGQQTHEGIIFRALTTHHDSSRGAERGGNTVWVIEAERLAVCHLGDLGHPLSPEDVVALGRINVLLVPVGGTYTIDAKGATAAVNRLRPNIAIPMHYHTPKTKLNLAPVEPFLAGKARVRKVEGSELEVSADSLPDPTEIVVLEPAL